MFSAYGAVNFLILKIGAPMRFNKIMLSSYHCLWHKSSAQYILSCFTLLKNVFVKFKLIIYPAGNEHDGHVSTHLTGLLGENFY